MATSPQIQNFEIAPTVDSRIAADVTESETDSHWLSCTAPAHSEARHLFALISRNGETVESIRELIAVPPDVENALRLYAREHSEDAAGVERALRFRGRVGEEFERLVSQRKVFHAPVGTQTADCSAGDSFPGIGFH